jgi:hypothetical protein
MVGSGSCWFDGWLVDFFFFLTLAAAAHTVRVLCCGYTCHYLNAYLARLVLPAFMPACPATACLPALYLPATTFPTGPCLLVFLPSLQWQ